MVWSLPEVMRVAYIFMMVMLQWLALWSVGASGVIASGVGNTGRWWLPVASLRHCLAGWQILSVSLFWAGAVLCNTVHVTVSGITCLVLIHGGRRVSSMPSRPILRSLQNTVASSFSSVKLISDNFKLKFALTVNESLSA